ARSLACSAFTGKGIAELWECVLEHQVMTQANGWLNQLRLEQNRGWMHETLEEGLMQLFRSNPVVQKRMAELERQVLAGQIAAFRAGRLLLSLYHPEALRQPAIEI